jgi:dienelactone hydrolase
MTSNLLLLALLATGQVREHPGGKELPHEKYIHVVSEADSPVQQTYIKTKDGLYIAAAIRKPKGDGPFPVLIHFHGAPGGRGMEKLVTWSRGDTGGPVWERFLQEGFVVVVADYRNPAGGFQELSRPVTPDVVSYADDGVAVVEHVRSLPYVDKDKITLYGVSLGGDVVLHTAGRTKVHAVILGAGAPIRFLGASLSPPRPGEQPKSGKIDDERARKNIEPIRCPVLILVGTADFLLDLDRTLYERLSAAGKPVRMEIYGKGYHDFVMGPQGHAGRAEPLLDATLEALEEAVKFAKEGEAKSSAKVDVSGKWKAEVDVGGQTGEPTFTLKQDGEKVTGKYEGLLGEQEVTGKVTSDKVEFEFSTDQGKVVYTGTLDKDTMKGTAKYSDLEGTWTAKREASKK